DAGSLSPMRTGAAVLFVSTSFFCAAVLETTTSDSSPTADNAAVALRIWRIFILLLLQDRPLARKSFFGPSQRPRPQLSVSVRRHRKPVLIWIQQIWPLPVLCPTLTNSRRYSRWNMSSTILVLRFISTIWPPIATRSQSGGGGGSLRSSSTGTG